MNELDAQVPARTETEFYRRVAFFWLSKRAVGNVKKDTVDAAVRSAIMVVRENWWSKILMPETMELRAAEGVKES